VLAEIAARLDSLEISTLSEGPHFSIFFREGCLAMAPSQEAGGGYAGIGSSGLLTDQGLLYLVYREQAPMLVGHSVEIPALPEQVDKILRFSADLKAALGLE
jgi:hypothetical protein